MPTDKLDADDFARALRQGRGAALQHVLSHGLDGVAEQVLAACLVDQAYDAQCEEARASWLYSMFRGAGEYGRFQRRIIAELSAPSEDSSIDQLCDLLALMARDGDLAAGDALRVFFRDQDDSINDMVFGSRALASLDGFPAILRIARRNGQLLQKYPFPSVDALDDLVDGDDALAATLAALKPYADADAAIAVYLANQEDMLAERRAYQHQTPAQRLATQAASHASLLAQFSIDDVLAAAAAHDRGRGKFYRFGRLCSDDDRATVAARLDVEPDVDACLRLLWVFRHAAPPAIPGRLWSLARHANPQIRDAALVALSQVNDPAVGEFGRRWLEVGAFGPDDAAVIELFGLNYADGDEAIIMRALETLDPGEVEAHDIGMSIRRFGERQNTAVAAGPMQWLYKTNPCTICRRHAIESMVAANTLPAAIADEYAFDASAAVRDLIKRPA